MFWQMFLLLLYLSPSDESLLYISHFDEQNINLALCILTVSVYTVKVYHFFTCTVQSAPAMLLLQYQNDISNNNYYLNDDTRTLYLQCFIYRLASPHQRHSLLSGDISNQSFSRDVLAQTVFDDSALLCSFSVSC